jgi:branched-chain amino acid transport system substrate-binding protein
MKFTVASLLLCCTTLFYPAASAAEPIVVGVSADMSRGGARSGEAIRRGVLLAIDEINASGGVLGRQLEIAVRDHRGVPARGRDNIVEMAALPHLVAIVGGLHTPVAMAELQPVHEHEVVYLGPWAAGTSVVENGYHPNYVFRVSVRDEYAGRFLIDTALRNGAKRPGLLLWRTAWGRSNEKAMQDALRARGLPIAPVTWFNTGQRDIQGPIESLYAQGADAVMLVANPAEGVSVVRAMAARSQRVRLPIISHWGITGGDFHSQVADVIDEIELTFLQTYSFYDPPFPRKARALQLRYCEMFDACGTEQIISPVGTAHAYDLIHLLSRAIRKAGSTDRPAVRAAMEQLERYEGLVRIYEQPFSVDRHDALDRADFSLAQFDAQGAIKPLQPD